MKLTRSALTLWLVMLSMAVQTPFGQARSMAAERPSSGGSLIIENAGQWPDAARFQVWGGGPTLWLAQDALWMSVVAGSQVEGSRFDPERVPGSRLGEPNLEPATLNGVNVRLSFPGANPHPRLEPFDRRDTHVSYFLGNDPAGWRPDVPVWGGVRYIDLYPGVDLVVGVGLVPAPAAPASDAGRLPGSPLPWRLEARAGADLAAVRLRVEGADAVMVEGDALRLGTVAGEVRVPLLTVEGPALSLPKGAHMQRTNVERVNPSSYDVIAPFTLASAVPKSAIGNSQSSGLLYSTFLGGSGEDEGHAIAVDGAGSAYVTGETSSSEFPTKPGAFDTRYNGSADAFVVKLNPAGSGLVYATFLGGSGYDGGYAIAVDGAGSAYVTGMAWSSDFPTTPGAFDTSYNPHDAFVAKLNPAGSELVYATFLRGCGFAFHYGIAVDGAGSAYVTAETWSIDFPATPGAFDTSYNGNDDAFVIKLNPAGSGLAYATFLGGSHGDYGYGIAVDGAGSAYVTGVTHSSDFPATPGALDTSFNGGWYDAFVVQLNPAGSRLTYAAFLGGGANDYGSRIAVNGTGSAYVMGYTESSDFPTTPGAFDTSYNGDDDAFVAKLHLAESGLAYATFLGGSSHEWGSGIAVDEAGSAYVTGYTYSSDFPATPGAFDTSFNGGAEWGDAFVAKLDPAGSGVAYATFLGGSSTDVGYGIAVGEAGSAYVTGYTYSSDFPTTRGAFDTRYHGRGDAFVAKLLVGAPPSPPAIQGTIWHDVDGDAARDAGEPGLAGVQVCAEPLGHRPVRCAISDPDGSYTIELDAPGTYLVAPSAAPAGMQLTTPGFRLPVVVREGEQVWDVDFGYR